MCLLICPIWSGRFFHGHYPNYHLTFHSLHIFITHGEDADISTQRCSCCGYQEGYQSGIQKSCLQLPLWLFQHCHWSPYDIHRTIKLCLHLNTDAFGWNWTYYCGNSLPTLPGIKHWHHHNLNPGRLGRLGKRIHHEQPPDCLRAPLLQRVWHPNILSPAVSEVRQNKKCLAMQSLFFPSCWGIEVTR